MVLVHHLHREEMLRFTLGMVGETCPNNGSWICWLEVIVDQKRGSRLTGSWLAQGMRSRDH